MAIWDDEKNDFWDFSKLVPKKQSKARPFSTEEKVVSFSDVGDQKTERESGEKPNLRLTDIARPDGKTLSETYAPEDNRLIRRVTVRHYADKYDFYESFRNSALLYFDVRGVACDFVPFYSFMPQYGQMTREQRAYYFYFRDAVAAGNFPKTDYSYLYLLVYEIINLPDKIPPEKGLDLLVLLWKNYRKSLPNIDRYFSVWVQDYCLIYRMKAPMKALSSFIFDVIGRTGFREFYLSDPESACSDGIAALTACLSDYDWRCGRYAGGESADVYRAHMEGALRPLLRAALSDSDFSGGKTALLVRDAFPYSLCTHSVKCRLEIEYYPISSAETLRAGVTAAIKYAENCLRREIGVKSRLSVRDLPPSYQKVIDEYFAGVFEQERRERQRAAVPAYEKNYDAPRETLSTAGADEIEKISWNTTLRLVDEEEAKELVMSIQPTIAKAEEKEADVVAAASPTTNALPLGESALAFLLAVMEGDSDRAYGMARAASTVPDALADEINTVFCDLIGDIVLDVTEDGVAFVEDYREDVEKWLKNLPK